MENTPSVLVSRFNPLLSKKLISGLNISAIKIDNDNNKIRLEIRKRNNTETIIATIIKVINIALFLKSFDINYYIIK